MEAYIEVISQIIVEVIDGTVILKGTDVTMGMSPNMDIKRYFDKDEYPNKDGCEAITRTLVAALSGNIHMAHRCGYRDSAEHLRSIISQLEDMFVLNPDLEFVGK